MPQGEGGGRPPVVFDDKQIAECEALAAVCTRTQIADYFGIHEDTLRAVAERQQEVFRALKKGKAKAVARIGQGVLSRALEGDNSASFFYLKCQGGWSEKIQIEADVETSVTLTLDGKTVDGKDLGW